MPYKVVWTTEGDDRPIVREQANRKTAIRCAEVPATRAGLFGGQDVEVIGLKGERMIASTIRGSDTVYLAVRDDHRIRIEGYATAEDAERAREDLRPGEDSAVRSVGSRLEWFEEMAQAGAGRTRKGRAESEPVRTGPIGS